MKSIKLLIIILGMLVYSATHLHAQSDTTAYSLAIADLGFTTDSSLILSDSLELELAQPTLAYINLTSKHGIPFTKTSNFKDWIEYYDPETDTYFKKRVLINVQGAYSTTFPKRGMSMEFCEDEWKMDSVSDIDFQGWVKQDAFHLKAFYADWLRGVGIVGYHIFDELEQTLPEAQNRIWKRAGVEAKKNARCYPDGFPCALYLNGDFYGLYVWQLKKHRRNTGQDKDNPKHIHLDGNMGENNFWNDNVKWTSVSVRNPKSLLDIEGNPYDVSNPTELEEGEVKASILALSRRCGELDSLKGSGAPAEEIRDTIAKYFDVTSMVNYLVFSLVTSNYDGFTKNWQWLTYDGQKWFVAPYDLDCTFGNYHAGTFVFPAAYSYVDSDYRFTVSRRGIATWFWDYFFDEIKSRYAELRDKKVFTASHISELIHDWYNRYGDSLYDAEWAAWPQCKCIGQTVTNEGWEVLDEWPDYYHVKEWSEEKTYEAGDLCRLAERIWRATSSTTGVRPYVSLGYTDSLERFDQWISQRIAYEDQYMEYEPQSIRDVNTADSEAFDISSAQIFDLAGRRISALKHGMNILRLNNGQTIKIYHQ